MRNTLRVLGLLSLFVSFAAAASGSLRVTLSQPAQKAEAEAGVVTVKMENTGNAPVYLLKWATPFAVNDDRLANVEFEVRDSAGRELPYQGRNVKFGAMTPDSFIVLAPRQSISKDIDLASDYNLEAGVYTATFSINLQYRPDSDSPSGARTASVPANAQAEVRSNTLTIWVNPAFSAARRLKSSVIGRANDQQYVCSADQITKLQSSTSVAAAQAYSAKN